MPLPFSPLVDAALLAAHLGSPELRVLDIRYDAEAQARFEAAHVPGAVHSNYAKEGWRGVEAGVQNVAPPLEDFAALLGRLGVAPAHHVVIVTPGESPNHAAGAARAYWMLKLCGHERISILDGGMRAWLSDPARPVESGPSPRFDGPAYPVRPNPRVLSGLDATQAAVASGAAIMLDARAESFFLGHEKSGDVLRPGRLPGAVASNYVEAVEPATGLLKPLDQLRAIHAALGDGPVINYCNTGHTAALNWFVLSEMLGRADVSLFDGSLSQWALDPARPLATGP